VVTRAENKKPLKNFLGGGFLLYTVG